MRKNVLQYNKLVGFDKTKGLTADEFVFFILLIAILLRKE